MKKIFELLGKIPRDKLLHYTISLGIAGVVGSILISLGTPILPSVLYGTGTSIAVGFLKEFYDEHKYGGFDWKDILADTLGSISGTILILLQHV